ncbi:hypothetical protein, partial [Serratia marcescens]|uniref:hypothetical protein n=1 Tax=Serratia marcescens TaxID=615 RepID=UPI001BCFE2A3
YRKRLINVREYSRKIIITTTRYSNVSILPSTYFYLCIFSILTPGISGLSMREEWRTKGAIDAAVMHGDANLYLRTVLDHLFTRDLDQVSKSAWREGCDINLLPDSGWKTFSTLLERCYQGVRVIVDHDPRRDRYVKVDVKTLDSVVTLDMA